MIQFYAYIHINNSDNQSIIESIINNTFSNTSIEWINDNIAKLIVIDEESFQLKLEKLHYLIFSDFNILSSILIVPCFNNIFIPYLKKLKLEVCTSFEIFLRHIHHKQTTNDAFKFKNSINKDNLDTIREYLKCNGNANAVAEELFLHKNTYAYRIKKFTSDTSLNYNDLNTLIFIKLILSITEY